ncbi:MAG: globin [Chloroflexaceae bacterium]|nr:globin [Chloroflexaceae bacterium]
MENTTIYEQVGGEATFRRLVDIFYDRIADDPRLHAMFPEDLEPGKERQFLFLVQYFGGPTTYNEQRGHPRLRMRHAPFPIGQLERDAWLEHMLAAVDEIGIQEPIRTTMHEYFERVSQAMINQIQPSGMMPLRG